MEINIGSYILQQRTEYSKLQLIDAATGENITSSNEKIAKKVFEDYKKQIENPEKYFKTDGNVLIEFCNSSREDIKYVFIPDKVEKIAPMVFNNNKILGIYIPNSLKTIDASAFCECDLLESVNIPDNVVELKSYAFQGCTSLKNVKLSSSLKFINRETFNGCTSLDNIDIPDLVECIFPNAFAGCKKLKNITLSKNLQEIGQGAFFKCDQLEKITLPENLKEIRSECFLGCASLKEIIIPDSVINVWYRAFAECTSLEYVKLSNKINALDIGIFEDCSSLRTLILSDNIKYFENNVFKNTPNLKNINIPKKLTRVKENLFATSGVKALTINHDIKDIEPSEAAMLDMVMYDRDHPINFGIIENSKVNKLIINNSVQVISPILVGRSGKQITFIDYLGTKEEFEKFKANNKEFFLRLPNLKEVNFVEKITEINIENIDR